MIADLNFGQIILVFIGALAGGLVNGLTGFGLALTAVGLWLYVLSPSVASSLAITCAIVSQIQNLHLIWGKVSWKLVLPFLAGGIIGVPLGTYLLQDVNPRIFKLCIGIVLIVYPAYVLARKSEIQTAWGGKVADATIGLGGGVLGGLAGLSGLLPAVWTDVRGWSKVERRSVVQTFNLTILVLALLSHVVAGLLTWSVATAAAIALPATMGGAWLGSLFYRRLADRGYQRVVMLLLLATGIGLVWVSR